jgi:hypothetical protein
MMRARSAAVKRSPDQRGFVVGFFFFTVVVFLTVVVLFFVVGVELADTRVECLARLWTVFLPAASDVVASANTASTASSSIFIDLRII